MTTFDDRERAFENLFAHDQDLLFRAQVRRDREVGRWAAGQLGLEGAEAESYVAAVLAASMDRGGTEAVVAKLQADLAGRGLHVTEHQVRRRMDEAMAESVDHVKRD